MSRLFIAAAAVVHRTGPGIHGPASGVVIPYPPLVRQAGNRLTSPRCPPPCSPTFADVRADSVPVGRTEKNLVFTKVEDKKTSNILHKLGSVKKENVNKLFSKKKCIILDPQAKKPLTCKDCLDAEAIINGGLLGYEKPSGRTKKLISDASGFTTRHLGKLQLSIDGAVFVAKAICLGLNLKDIEIAKEIEIHHDSIHSTILPFGYPIIENKPVITPGLINYLTKL